MNKKDKLILIQKDRRVLSNVPDPEGIRSKTDRRGNDAPEKGTRYKIETGNPVTCTCIGVDGKRRTFVSKEKDISATGIGLEVNEEQQQWLEEAKTIRLRFEVEPGSMPEGLERKVSIRASFVRKTKEAGVLGVGLQFQKDLYTKTKQTKGTLLLVVSSIFLVFISLFILLMRAESLLYFRFNRVLYSYSIMTAFFLLSRYVFASFYRPTPIDAEYTPGVTILIPCFNEEQWIKQTIQSCMNQDYPIDKLEVIVIDDFSTDKSVEKIEKTIKHLKKEAERFKVGERLKLIAMEENKGKREALALGVLEAKHELVVFVDSDSFLDPLAIRYLVQPFKDPKMGGVAGRTDVANTFTNTLTKMQSVRYYIAFRVMKAAEACFDTVTCLSGPLACYKKEIILENREAWLNQKFLGQRATFGDDRAMTNFVLRKHRTNYQDTAICSTVVPNDYSVFLKQQMRWKRSWLRESLIAGKFMWRKEPFAAVSFYIGLFVPILAPIVVIYNLIYVPITQNVFPTTFLVGLLMMAMLMSMAQLLLRKSTTWFYGIWFCVFYEAVLLWQMPIAWVTFWKSTWGTRMTPSDVAEQEKKDKKKKSKG